MKPVEVLCALEPAVQSDDLVYFRSNGRVNRYIWQRPSLKEKLRDEILPTITYSGDGATRQAILDIRTLEKECPTLLGCQREGIRVSNHMVARRAITADTLLTDENGDTV